MARQRTAIKGNRIIKQDEKYTVIEIISKGISYECKFDTFNAPNFLQYTWTLNDGYAINKSAQRMSRMVKSGKLIDHIDQNRLNNTVENLRDTTRSINVQNSKRSPNRASAYYGVSYQLKERKFVTRVREEYVGAFDDELDAAYAYDEYVLQHYPEDQEFLRKLNNIPKPENYKTYERQNDKSQPDLPKGVSYLSIKKKYRVFIEYKGFKSPFLVFDSKEEAVKKCEELRSELVTKWNDKMDNLPITRNKENVAVLVSNKGEEIMVDDENWHKLNKMCIWGVRDGYVYGKNEDGKRIMLHRYVMKCTDEDLGVDHKYGNTLDNRKANLRVLHRKDPLHAHNRQKKQGCASQYQGVTKHKTKWQGKIRYNSQSYASKVCDTEIEAAMFFDLKAIELFGKDARLNFPDDPVNLELIRTVVPKNAALSAKLLQKRTRSESTDKENDVKRHKTD
jgi:hypothetical protein